MSKIVVLGSLNMDLVTMVSRQPKMGETLMGESFKTVCGGKGGNQAVAIARLGGDVSMLGMVGNDAYGELLKENLRKSGANADNIGVCENSSGIAAITVAGGDNSIVVVKGANREVSPDYVKQKESEIENAEYLVMQLEIPFDTVEEAMKTANKYGTRVVFNPAPMDISCKKLLKYVDILVVNEHEAGMICDFDVVDKEDAESAIAKIKQMGAKDVIVTLGEKGAVYGGEKNIFVPAKKVKAVDTTAAGDSFIGATLVRLSEGADIEEAMTFAASVSAIVVSRRGASDSIPFRSEVM